jgi:hypothetical protein
LFVDWQRIVCAGQIVKFLIIIRIKINGVSGLTIQSAGWAARIIGNGGQAATLTGKQHVIAAYNVGREVTTDGLHWPERDQSISQRVGGLSGASQGESARGGDGDDTFDS